MNRGRNRNRSRSSIARSVRAITRRNRRQHPLSMRIIPYRGTTLPNITNTTKQKRWYRYISPKPTSGAWTITTSVIASAILPGENGFIYIHKVRVANPNNEVTTSVTPSMVLTVVPSYGMQYSDGEDFSNYAVSGSSVAVVEFENSQLNQITPIAISAIGQTFISVHSVPPIVTSLVVDVLATAVKIEEIKQPSNVQNRPDASPPTPMSASSFDQCVDAT